MKETSIDISTPDSRIKEKFSIYIRILQVVLAVFIFFLSIHLLSLAFTNLNKSIVESIINATTDPFIGLFIGLLITSVIQSSSTSTSIIVAVVASGTLNLENAIPLVMGANIGTTITSTLVSLGFINRKKEFRKAIAAGTLHDFFNILTAFILFPLEYHFKLLSKPAEAIASSLQFLKTGSSDSPFFFVDYSFIGKVNIYILEKVGNSFAVIILALILIFASIKIISSLMFRSLLGDSKDQINNLIFKSKISSFSWGTVFTLAVQSSSITTPLVVPLVATGRISLTKAFPFILGANIGTTVTALLAALFKSDAALSIAIVHLLFNLGGVLIFFPFKSLRMIPVYFASKLGALTKKYRLVGLVYIVLIFFLIPFSLIYFNQQHKKETLQQKSVMPDEAKPQEPQEELTQQINYL